MFDFFTFAIVRHDDAVVQVRVVQQARMPCLFLPPEPFSRLAYATRSGRAAQSHGVDAMNQQFAPLAAAIWHSCGCPSGGRLL